MIKKWINRMIECAFIFFLAAYLIHVGACWLYSVWPVLAVIGIILIIVIIIYRIVKHKRDSDKW